MGQVWLLTSNLLRNLAGKGSMLFEQGVKEWEGFFSLWKRRDFREDSSRLQKGWEVVLPCPKVKAKGNGLALVLGGLDHS